MVTLALDIQGKEHVVAVLRNEGREEPALQPRELSAIYEEYIRLGRTLTEYESGILIEIAQTLH